MIVNNIDFNIVLLISVNDSSRFHINISVVTESWRISAHVFDCQINIWSANAWSIFLRIRNERSFSLFRQYRSFKENVIRVDLSEPTIHSSDPVYCLDEKQTVERDSIPPSLQLACSRRLLKPKRSSREPTLQRYHEVIVITEGLLVSLTRGISSRLSISCSSLDFPEHFYKLKEKPIWRKTNGISTRRYNKSSLQLNQPVACWIYKSIVTNWISFINLFSTHQTLTFSIQRSLCSQICVVMLFFDPYSESDLETM